MECSSAHQDILTDTLGTHQFSFGKVRVLRHDLAEITVNEGADINIKMVDELHELLLSLFTNSFSLLINKVNSYSTKFDALSRFGQLPVIDKIAVFAPSKMAKFSADFAANIPSSMRLDIKVFSKREDALTWLDADGD